MAATATKEPLPTLCNYEVLEKIADGSMASVYKGRHRATGALVAIKIPWPVVAGDAVLRKRFQEEFRAGSNLRHPNLVQAVDFGCEDGTFYLVMEFVEGQDLWQRIEQTGRLGEAEAVHVIIQVAQALHLAHKHGIVHRDVKPDNILLTADGQAKLTDLGLVKNLEANLDLTRPHKGLGTPNFIAPEQFRDAKNAGVRCDVYALGATLYMAVTGELPFRARGLTGILQKKLANDLTPPRQLVPTLSEALDWTVRRAVQADPQRRYASCRELIQALTEKTADPNAGLAVRPAVEAGPRGESAASREAERRMSVRYPCTLATVCGLEASIHPGGDGEDYWEGTVQDLSVSGISLLLRRRFQPRTVLTVELQSPDLGHKCRLEMRVSRVRRAGQGQWSVGGVFTQPLSKDELRNLL